MTYGSKTSQVEMHLEQIRALDIAACQALKVIRYTSWSVKWHQARDAAKAVEASGWKETRVAFEKDALDACREVVWKIRCHTAQTEGRTMSDDEAGSIWDVLWDPIEGAVLGTVLEDLLTPEQHQTLVGPFELVVALPPWWSDPGEQNLFHELVGEGLSILDARRSVDAL